MDAEADPEREPPISEVADAPAPPPVEEAAPVAPLSSDAEVAAVTAEPDRHTPDRLALAIAVGIAVLLIACAALMLVAWHRAPTGPVVPAPGWFRLGP